MAKITKGKLKKIKKPFMNLKERFLVVDPFQGSIFRYESEDDYPKKPIEITSLSTVVNAKLVEDSDKSWHMRRDLVYFELESQKK